MGRPKPARLPPIKRKGVQKGNRHDGWEDRPMPLLMGVADIPPCPHCGCRATLKIDEFDQSCWCDCHTSFRIVNNLPRSPT